MSKRGLGMGLGALLDSSESQYSATTNKKGAKEKADAEAIEVSVKTIMPNPYQPRKVFDQEKLEELVSSIKEHGIIQPLIVRKNGSLNELVAGERRLRAAKLAKLKTVPVIFRTYDDRQMMEIALVENIQRRDLNPIEEAEGIKALMTTCRLTQEQAAIKVGRSRTAIANILRLLNLPQELQEYVSRETLTMGQVRPLLALTTKEQQTEVAEEIVKNGWSARTVEEVVKELKAGHKLTVVREIVQVAEDKEKQKSPKAEKPALDVHYKEFEDSLVSFFGTKVKVVAKNKNAGKIEIEYYSEDDLNRIYELLQHNKEVKTADKARKAFTV